MANISQITIDNNTFDIKDTQARNGLDDKQDVLTPGQNISITKDTTTGETIISTTGGGGRDIQYDIMPTASADYVGRIIQYIGETDSDYTNGYFYKCIYDVSNNVYRWEQTDTSGMSSRVSDIESLIPSTATSSNKLATASDVSAKQSQITQSSLLTLTVAGWDSTTLQQTVSFAHDTTKRNVIDITIGEMITWGECGVRAVSETATGITFECDTVPETALTFTVTSMEVN